MKSLKVNTLFFNIASNLKIVEYANSDPISDNINDPVIKSIKFRFDKSKQDSDIPRKIIKDNVDIFSDFLLLGFNNSITTSVFPSSLKQAILNKHQF